MYGIGSAVSDETLLVDVSMFPSKIPVLGQMEPHILDGFGIRKTSAHSIDDVWDCTGQLRTLQIGVHKPTQVIRAGVSFTEYLDRRVGTHRGRRG